MGQFIMTDCVECSTPEIGLTNCEFGCGEGFCTYCWENNTKQCAGCGHRGCRAHFDGMFCLECRAAEDS